MVYLLVLKTMEVWFSELKVYDMKSGKPVTYTVSEINVATRYETPKAQNVTLTSGNADLTVNVKFNNELKTGAIKINKQSEDGENGDRTFEITGNGKKYSIKTGSDGIAVLSDIQGRGTSRDGSSIQQPLMFA